LRLFYAAGDFLGRVNKVIMPAVLDRSDLDTRPFDREAFHRAWQHEDDTPHARTAPDTAILVSRTSTHDFQDRQIYVWIDEEPLGKIRYGDAISRPIEPGRHSIRVFNTMFTRTLIVDAAPGEQVRVQCGTGMPRAGWLLMIFLHVTYLRVWVRREGS
jgi:hypothetical protein